MTEEHSTDRRIVGLPVAVAVAVAVGMLAVLTVAAVALVVSFLTERSSSDPDWPALPPGVEEPAEYAFGDAVAREDQQAWGAVFDALAPDYDERALRVVHLTRDAGIDAEVVRLAYDKELADDRGWRVVTPDVVVDDDVWVHGYESPDGDDVLVLVGFEPGSGDAFVPLSIVTTLPGHS